MFFGPGAKVNKSRHTIRVWAWFFSSGAGAIRRVDEGMGDEEFLEMLEEALVPQVYSKFGLDPISFQHERSSVFPSNFLTGPVREWFNDHEEFKLQPWPPKSRDFNPFSTIWSDFARSIQLQRLQPIDDVELFEGISELFGYRQEKPLYWEGLIKSLKHNLNLVKESEGAVLP